MINIVTSTKHVIILEILCQNILHFLDNRINNLSVSPVRRYNDKERYD